MLYILLLSTQFGEIDYYCFDKTKYLEDFLYEELEHLIEDVNVEELLTNREFCLENLHLKIIAV